MKYLAYGANLNSEIFCARCPNAKFLGVDVLEGYRLMFKGEEPLAYATIEPWENFSVPYVLWEISEDDEKALDRYEGYPKHYQKHTVNIEFGGEKYSAMYYAKPEEEQVGQPMTHYVEVISQAYKDYKFDEKILLLALALSDEFYQRKMRIMRQGEDV